MCLASEEHVSSGYDAVVLSEDHRTRKPEPEIFRLVLTQLGLTADECVFVDDTEQYLPPAADLGFATVHAVERPPPSRKASCASGVPTPPSVSRSSHR
ncbi:hypothetical protein SSP24_04270 [Streptomyces spinoverrucosus]|uniref:Uncharacterized protein n=1 Tax=Streptomyces spinoverrucosus TaxID=284043 RepID=A0A4Y3V699_9ACTN|nr:hypothetical protein SSP24_04270 [Streptomyces spinoverrucosus]GHB40595.1 hypothetical protein GCM10010397_08330 [Streptomyces spinoverrucosus]